MVAGMATGEALHERADRRGLTGSKQQVHVIRHEAEGIELDAVYLLELPKRIEIALVIFLFREDDLAVVAPLDDVVRVVRQDDSPHPWHGGPPCYSWLLRKITGG